MKRWAIPILRVKETGEMVTGMPCADRVGLNAYLDYMRRQFSPVEPSYTVWITAKAPPPVASLLAECISDEGVPRRQFIILGRK